MGYCFDRFSPALKEILLKLHSIENFTETDYKLYEFGLVRYHIQASSSQSHQIYLSVAVPVLSQEIPFSSSKFISQATYSQVVNIVEPPETGYQLTLQIDLTKFPKTKEASSKLITDISSLHADILSSQLKDIIWLICFQNNLHGGLNKPIKFEFNQRDQFFIIRQKEKITVIFPMRFGDESDVIIARTLFQELMGLGCSRGLAKAPPCSWSPVPPSELRGESIQDLSTNGGFVSLDIFWRHVKGSKLNKTIWNLLNFHTYVKYYVKCTRSFIQRRMRKRVENLSQVLLNQPVSKKNENNEMNRNGPKLMKSLTSFSKPLKKRFGNITKKIKQIRSKIKIYRFKQFMYRRWLKLPQFYSFRRYSKLDKL